MHSFYEPEKLECVDIYVSKGVKTCFAFLIQLAVLDNHPHKNLKNGGY